MKCAKCGYVELYWMPDWHDVERQYAKTDDVWNDLPSVVREADPDTIVEASDGFAYRRGKGRYIRRMPVEIWRARGFWSRPKGYFDPAGRINNGFEKMFADRKGLKS